MGAYTSCPEVEQKSCPHGLNTETGICMDPPTTCPHGLNTETGICMDPPKTCKYGLDTSTNECKNNPVDWVTAYVLEKNTTTPFILQHHGNIPNELEKISSKYNCFTNEEGADCVSMLTLEEVGSDTCTRGDSKQWKMAKM